jgi:excisionase family DNA binding protein
MENTDSSLISTKDAAQRLGVHSSTLRDWAVRGKLPFHKVGRIYKFTSADVEVFIAYTRVQAQPQSTLFPCPPSPVASEEAPAAEEVLL